MSWVTVTRARVRDARKFRYPYRLWGGAPRHHEPPTGRDLPERGAPGGRSPPASAQR